MFVGMEKMTHSVKNILQLQFLCLLKFKNIDCDPLILEYVLTKSNTTQLSSYKPSLSGIPPRISEIMEKKLFCYCPSFSTHVFGEVAVSD